MINNQFAVLPTDLETQAAELKKLWILTNIWQVIPASDVLAEALKAIRPTARTSTAQKEWLASLAVNQTTNFNQWLAEKRPLKRDEFALLALQLLGFTAGVDYQLDDPQAAVEKIHLPLHYPEPWSNEAVVQAIYSLMVSRTAHGYRYIDELATQGMLGWTYSLPGKDKPLFFNGLSLPCFDPESFIHEVVYIETDLDTDFDGKADLVKAEITRPQETWSEMAHPLQVPAVFTASPYNQGTNDAWGEKVTHPVNHPITHKTPGEQAPAEMEFPKPKHYQKVTGKAEKASQRFAETPAYTLNDYLAVRGYAIVYSAGIGTQDSDGLQTCGSPEQTEAMKAVVEWLHGDRRAFSDRTSGQEVTADWCNGNVAMTGRSYLGTLATAVATTGVPGLKAIISEAAISSWYDYYRENGLVMAPGGFQGEDADVLAAETFSRTNNLAEYLKVKPTNDKYLQAMAAAQDRETGNYNDFWAKRNYRPAIDQIKCAVMMVHGLNDDNVKPNQVKALVEGLEASGHPYKLVLHQGKHIYINAFQSLDFSEIVNYWLAQHLWDQDNGADDRLPKVLVQDNARPQTWHVADSWDGKTTRHYHLGTGVLSEKPVEATTQFFTDGHANEVYRRWCDHPQAWQSALLADNGSFSAAFATAPVAEETVLKGTPKLHARVKVNADHGLLSAFLIDRGVAKRLKPTPTILAPRSLRADYHFGCDDLREFELKAQPSLAKVISFGHINLQNRHSPATVDDLAADQYVDVTFDLQPIYHHLLAGHQLELRVFATDYLMTLRGNEPLIYTLDLSHCSLDVPMD